MESVGFGYRLCSAIAYGYYSTVDADGCVAAEWRQEAISYCLRTARRESLPKIADMDVEMTT